jgi:hypothetical protein
MNKEGSGRKRQWLLLKYFGSIRLKRLRTHMTNLRVVKVGPLYSDVLSDLKLKSKSLMSYGNVECESGLSNFVFYSKINYMFSIFMHTGI